MRQLRNFGACAGADDGILAGAGEVAFLTEPKAETPAIAFSGEVAKDPVTAGTCDILQSGNGRYCVGRSMDYNKVVILSTLITPAAVIFWHLLST